MLEHTVNAHHKIVGAMGQAFHIAIPITCTTIPKVDGITIPILQMRMLRHKGIKYLVQVNRQYHF